MRTRSLFMLMLVAVALLSGCSPAQPSIPASKEPASSSSQNQPGTYEMPDGRVRVVGTLTHSNLEGGFYGVQLQRPWDSMSNPTVVISNPNDLVNLKRANIEGWGYVAVTGRLLDGASIRMAGQEIEADSLEKLDPPIR